MLTWDADAEPDARDFFVNQATAEGIANALTDEAARLLGGKGEFAIITGALSAANQNEWIAFIRKRLADKHPGLKLATIRPSDDDRDKAFAETQTMLKVYPIGEADDGDLGAGGARLGRSGAAGRPQGRQRHRAVAAEHQQAVRPRRRRADRRAVEYPRSRIPRRLRERARRRRTSWRRAHTRFRPDGWDRSRSATARSFSARRCCSTGATSIASISRAGDTRAGREDTTRL